MDVSFGPAGKMDPCRKKLYELFFVWLSQPVTQSVLVKLVNSLREGTSIDVALSSMSLSLSNNASPTWSPSSAASPPPRSPSKPRGGPGSPMGSPLGLISSPQLGHNEQFVVSDIAPAGTSESPSHAKTPPSAGISPVRSPAPEEALSAKVKAGVRSSPLAGTPNRDLNLDDSEEELMPIETKSVLRTPVKKAQVEEVSVHSGKAAPSPVTSKQIPIFWFPNQPRVADEVVDRELGVIDSVYVDFEKGIPIPADGVVPANVPAPDGEEGNGTIDPSRDGFKLENPLRALWAHVTGLPLILCKPCFKRWFKHKGIADGKDAVVTKEQFLEYYEQKIKLFKPHERLFNALQKFPKEDQKERDYLDPDDFMDFMLELLDIHPGLEFLKKAEEFQARYAETVTLRIFFSLDTLDIGRISLSQLRKSELMDAYLEVDRTEDINKVLRFFSYEHFYVLYCKFFELDVDHDLFVTRDDLLRYANYSLSFRTCERIFQQKPRKFQSGQDDKMGYLDFAHFLLVEEDKNTATARRYWFKVADLDDDGIITPFDTKFFFEEQQHRLQNLSQEVVSYEDIMCQMNDMVMPEREAFFTMQDLVKCRMASNLFNVLFNLHKFLAFEQRDPFTVHYADDALEANDWDRFARIEYDRLAMEDEAGGDEAAMAVEGDDLGLEGGDGWEPSSNQLLFQQNAMF